MIARKRSILFDAYDSHVKKGYIKPINLNGTDEHRIEMIKNWLKQNIQTPKVLPAMIKVDPMAGVNHAPPQAADIYPGVVSPQALLQPATESPGYAAHTTPVLGNQLFAVPDTQAIGQVISDPHSALQERSGQVFGFMSLSPVQTVSGKTNCGPYKINIQPVTTYSLSSLNAISNTGLALQNQKTGGVVLDTHSIVIPQSFMGNHTTCWVPESGTSVLQN